MNFAYLPMGSMQLGPNGELFPTSLPSSPLPAASSVRGHPSAYHTVAAPAPAPNGSSSSAAANWKMTDLAPLYSAAPHGFALVEPMTVSSSGHHAVMPMTVAGLDGQLVEPLQAQPVAMPVAQSQIPKDDDDDDDNEANEKKQHHELKTMLQMKQEELKPLPQFNLQVVHPQHMTQQHFATDQLHPVSNSVRQIEQRTLLPPQQQQQGEQRQQESQPTSFWHTRLPVERDSSNSSAGPLLKNNNNDDDDDDNEVVDVKNRHVCQICRKTFRSQGNLKRHNKDFHERRNDRVTYHCDLCRKDFQNRYNLRRHRLGVHGSEEPKSRSVLCPVCGKAFIYADNLKRHKRNVHGLADEPGGPRMTQTGLEEEDGPDDDSAASEEARFVCGICQKDLLNQSNLKRHVQSVHKNARLLYGCDECEKTFATIANYRRHKLVAHAHAHGRVVFECPACGKAFSTKDALDRHSASVHASPGKGLAVLPADSTTASSAFRQAAQQAPKLAAEQALKHAIQQAKEQAFKQAHGHSLGV